MEWLLIWEKLKLHPIYSRPHMKKSRYSQHSYLEDGELLHKNKNKNKNKKKIDFIFNILDLIQGFKSTDAHWALPSLHLGSLEIMLKVHWRINTSSRSFQYSESSSSAFLEGKHGSWNPVPSRLSNRNPCLYGALLKKNKKDIIIYNKYF